MLHRQDNEPNVRKKVSIQLGRGLWEKQKNAGNSARSLGMLTPIMVKKTKDKTLNID